MCKVEQKKDEHCTHSTLPVSLSYITVMCSIGMVSCCESEKPEARFRS